MAVHSNLSWPEDPYGTGQLWRKEPQLAACFAAQFVDDGQHAVPVAYSVVYLPLHRTKPVDASNGPHFGFRAVTAVADAELPALLELFELDASRARRLARIVAAHQLGDALHAIVTLAPTSGASRGTRALAHAWDTGENGPSMAELAEATPPGTALIDAAAAAGIPPVSVQRAFEPQDTFDELLAEARGPNLPGLALDGDDGRRTRTRRQISEWFGASATESALVAGLTALHRLGRYRWNGPLHIGHAMNTNLSDCFPTQTFGSTFTTPPQSHLPS
ncbi:hypothetical protein GCM10027589_00320 [Actinocorallia lasiicapitis]